MRRFALSIFLGAQEGCWLRLFLSLTPGPEAQLSGDSH